MSNYDRRQQDIPVDVDRRRADLLHKITVSERIISKGPEDGDPIIHQIIAQELEKDLVGLRGELAEIEGAAR